MAKINDLFSKVYKKNKAKKLRVLGINGSPRLGGNTDILLDKSLEGSASEGSITEKIILNDLRFSPCQECENMPDDGTCNVRDDLPAVYAKIEQADVLILASPIFFGSLSAQTKMFIDRFQCLWRAKYVLKNLPPQKSKIGAFICVEASSKQEFFLNARSIVKNIFATLNVEYREELFCPGVDEKGKVLNFPDILQRSFELGQKLVLAGQD